MSVNDERPKTLYAVFHGEFCFFDGGKDAEYIDVYAPAMDIHVYSAGPWLGENRLPPGMEMRLEGALAGGRSLVAEPLVTLTYSQCGPPRTRPYVHITVPRPKEIFAGKRELMPLDPIVVKGAPAPAAPDNRVALAVIFQYDVDPDLPSGQTPGLRPLAELPRGFEPNWNSHSGNGTHYVLHAFAEADCPPGPDHIKMASEMAASLLGLEATVTPPDGKVNDKLSTPPPGLTSQEINMTLADRTVWLAIVGGALQAGNPIPDGPGKNLGAGTGSCGCAIGGAGKGT